MRLRVVPTVAVALLLLGADKPALEMAAKGNRVEVRGEGFITVADRAQVDAARKTVTVEGQAVIQGEGFYGTAHRVEVDSAKATLTLTGQPDHPALIVCTQSKPGEPTHMQARKLII